MTHDNPQHSTIASSSTSFGSRLKLAREVLGLESKDAAAQLRLNEKYIHMMEKENYPNDLPSIFIRGYLRAYGRLLQIPAHDIEEALTQLQPIQCKHDAPLLMLKSLSPMTHDQYFIRFFTYLTLLALFGLILVWWYAHVTSPSPLVENTPNMIFDKSKSVLAQTPPPSENNINRKIIAVPAVTIKSPSLSNAMDPFNDDAQAV
ncbi:MAG TPA: helix-turn-helix domain-containing protein [Gammaproteobacteria bacterium]|nr:helix-turn-helix domain-containing protein [Gammaproteobacteria bacterium]